MLGQYTVVVQAVRYNKLTERSTLYVLAVKGPTTKDLAEKHSEELQKKGYVVDVLPIQPLPDQV